MAAAVPQEHDDDELRLVGRRVGREPAEAAQVPVLPATATSGSKAALAVPSLTAPTKPAVRPSSRVPSGSRQRSVAAKPSGPLTCGWSTTPPLTVAEISTASCTAEVAMPSAWLDRWPTAVGRTKSGTRPAASPVRLMPDGSPRPSRCA